jgi:predicted acylesterase/phospholipase RssA
MEAAIMRTIDVLSALSALGALPSLSQAVTKYARAAMRWLRERRSRQLRLPLAVLLVFVMSLLSLQGCVPAATSVKAPAQAVTGPPYTIRTLGPDQRFMELSIPAVAQRIREGQASEPLSILALSGGGADGAFGAGALVGLTRSGARPRFSVVTGVSAGALIAPYAFLGPEWDADLINAYTTGRAEHLLQTRGFGMLFGSSLYRGTPLKQLVDQYLSDAMIQAIAREAATGRLLLVATTNVDTAEPVVWDLGAIAMYGGDKAKALFRDILVASASVPGMFPPVIIRLQENGDPYEEAHVDGTTTVPFFVPSLSQMAADAAQRSEGATVYVIVDRRLSEEPLSVRLHTRAILSRSVSAGLTHMVRTSLELTAATARLQGIAFRYSAIPADYPNLNSFDFRALPMRSLFQYGYQCAQAGRLWIAAQRGASERVTRAGAFNAEKVPCPSDDEFIERFALR